MKPSDRPRRVDEVTERREGSMVTVYHPLTGRAHALNPTAYAIWELCDGETLVEEMAAAVAGLAGLAPEEALGQVTRTLADLADARLITF